MKTLTVDELKAMLESHCKYLAGESSGERADFVSCDLSYANLSGAYLSGAYLSYANLSYADLSGANLRSADLSGANLRSADLSGANLRSADLRSANLRSADLRSANLRSADLGSKTELGWRLRVIGACMPAVAWVDKQKDHSNPTVLLASAEPAYATWLSEALGGEATMARLDAVVDFITKGKS